MACKDSNKSNTFKMIWSVWQEACFKGIFRPFKNVEGVMRRYLRTLSK